VAALAAGLIDCKLEMAVSAADVSPEASAVPSSLIRESKLVVLVEDVELVELVASVLAVAVELVELVELEAPGALACISS
jgi:hypothetical protein